MTGKAKRAKIMLPKRIIRASSPATPNQIPAKANATRNKLIFSSTLQDGPVIPPNEIRLVFEREFSTIREESGNVSEREIPTIDDVESSEESDTLIEIETPKRGENPELQKSSSGSKHVSIRNCKLAQDHESGCDVCSNSKPDGSNQVQDGKDDGMEEQEPFCSSFNEDISRVPQKMEFQSENSFSIIVGPTNKQHHMRPSTSSNTKRNVLSTLQDGADETDNLFGRGPAADELIKMDDSASQHEFRYYNGIRQRYCSSFKGNGFNVPDLIGFSCEESESTILNPTDHQETNDSSESDEHTLQSESEALDESVVLSADDSSIPSPPSKLRKTHKEPFCSTFRASITTEPSHMSFNQDKGGPTLRPRKIPVSIVEKETERDSTLNSKGDEKDTDYSASDSETSDEEAELGIQKCVWMEAHFLGCVHCNPVKIVKAGSRDYPQRTSQRKVGHICPTCNKNFGQKGNLARHVLTVHEKKKPYSCNKCEKSFGERKHLDTHILTVHEKKKPHACSKCDQSFGIKHNLDIHILTVHEKKKPHACSKCDQSFGHKQTLNRHVLTVHEKKKPHACSKCDQTFGHKQTLNTHILTFHEKTKPHACSKCDQSFGRKYILVAHLRIHNGEKPFTCPDCKDSFTQKGTLTTHMRIHSKDNPFQCTTCNRKFNRKSRLRQHEKTQHPENVSETDSE